MGLFDKLEQRRDRELLANSRERLAADRQRDVALEIIIDSADQHLTSRSNDMGVKFDVLSAQKQFPRYYLIGDMVFTVEPFSAKAELEYDDRRPRKHLEKLRISVFAYDRRSKRMQAVRVGTLRYFTFDGLYQTMVQQPTYLDFKQSARIRELARQQIERLEGPVCGRPVILHLNDADEAKKLVLTGANPTRPCLLPPGHKGSCNESPSP